MTPAAHTCSERPRVGVRAQFLFGFSLDINHWRLGVLAASRWLLVCRRTRSPSGRLLRDFLVIWVAQFRWTLLLFFRFVSFLPFRVLSLSTAAPPSEHPKSGSRRVPRPARQRQTCFIPKNGQIPLELDVIRPPLSLNTGLF